MSNTAANLIEFKRQVAQEYLAGETWAHQAPRDQPAR